MINAINNSPTFPRKSAMKETSGYDCRQLSSPERRAVSFGQSDNEMETVAVRTIPAISDFSKEERKNMWYTECEFQLMKLAIVQILRKVINGTYGHEMGCLESEARGLENKTPKGSQARKSNRFASLYAVLDEQDRQRQQGQAVDSEYIAKLYRQSTAQSQMEAIQIAANDFKIIHGEEALTTCDKKSLQKLLEPPASPSRSAVARTIAASPIKSRSRRRLLSMIICK